ncbi:unnamed protein product [Parnassius mnemosyne]|uniref:Uncharacterized protein n=1 Tax=Parnassius mnemosyne TaxID=213953 RepID=A0AAV1LEQ7_9NEOP
MNRLIYVAPWNAISSYYFNIENSIQVLEKLLEFQFDNDKYEIHTFLMRLYQVENNNDAILDQPSTEQTTYGPPSPTNTSPTPPKKRKYDPKLAMLKDAFGILKLASTKSNQDDVIGTFCKFLENKLRSYDHRTKNLVQQRLCDIVFKADAEYFSNNEQYGYYTSQSQNYYTTRPETATLIYSSAHSRPTGSTSEAGISQSSPSGSHYSADSFDVDDFV